jgi:hypothetical protein
MLRAVFTLLVIPALALSQQDVPRVTRASRDTRPAPATTAATAATAVRATSPLLIDGKDTDPVWSQATEISGFRVYDPVEDGEPAMRTIAKVAFDDRNLYVLVRAFDPHPDSIVSLLSRRDVKTPSDQIKIFVDSYFDRRTGYEFAVNPAGVKRDFYVFNDTEEDASWDGVWDVATSIDSLGWIAEFRIPLSQLRFPKRASHTFGIGVFRDVGRSNERSGWPLLRRSKFGFTSQLGTVSGIEGIATPRRLEVVPYTVQKNVTQLKNDSYGRDQQMAVGADIKYGLTSNLTIDATVNPDFGQVEADPAVLNLSAFEQFYTERRPFFMEGTGIFRFDMSCSDDVCTGLFYSRRIGRAPQLTDRLSDASVAPGATTILGASKLTGRLSRGLSVGMIDAVTQEERVQGISVEPRSNYFVGRLQQDFRNGESGIGMMFTGVNRALDDSTATYLRREAYTAGVDFRHRFLGGRLKLGGYLATSYVAGTPQAITRTQMSSVHNFQRPDDPRLDSTRTSLSGTSFQLGLNKIGGDITRFWTGYSRSSSGFEINDVGFLTNVDEQGYSNWFALVFNAPHAFYRRLQVNFNEWQNFTIGGLRTSLGGNINANASLKNMWFVYSGVGVNLPSYCTGCMRGGPAVRTSTGLNSWAGVMGDTRRTIYPALDVGYSRRDLGRSWNYSAAPRIEGRVSSRFQMSIGTQFSRNVNDAQWKDNFGDAGIDTTHYTVAHLEQKTTSLTARMDFTATPNLTLQLYAQPFISSGAYSNWRELNQPRAVSYDARFKPYTAGGDPGGFNYKQFRSNTVVRWEYRPGSTLFVVWQQGRTQDDIDPGTFDFSRDYRNLFSAHPDNTLLVKASYWLSL